MRFAITGEHQKFFREKGYIEFEELLSDAQVDSMRSSLLSLALKKNLTFQELLINGHNISETNSHHLKWIFKKNFAEILFHLSNERPLRLAYDQFLCTLKQEQKPDSLEKLSLKKISGLQGNVYGLLLSLQNSLSEMSPPFSQKKGAGFFFSSEVCLDFSPLFANKENLSFVLIVFTGARSIVLHEQFFPMNYKNLGYSVGDLLNDEKNPIIYR